MLTLEVMICTLGRRISQVENVLLPPAGGVEYLVSWQPDGEDDGAIPPALRERTDVRLVRTGRRGLSANRNNALAAARGDLLLISDDDTRYRPEYFGNIRRAFEAHPEADIIHFQALNEHGRPMRRYSPVAFTFGSRPRRTFFASWEIVCRRSDRLPRFDERFGLGSEHLACGEEEIFVFEAVRRGLAVRYEPLPIVQTNGATTGTLFATSAAVRRSKGAVLCYLHGPFGAALRCLKFALTLPRRLPRTRCFLDMWQGIRYFQTSESHIQTSEK